MSLKVTSAFFRSGLALLLITLWPGASSTVTHAQGKRPITHEDVWLMKRVGAPVPSPDGKWVVFSVTEPAYDEKDQSSDLWIVPADGSRPPRKLTNTKSGESGATWSPDSTRIVFSARREGDEVAQLYLLDVVGGGEAMRVTSLSTGARSPQFSPDGKRLLFVSTVYPGAMNDEDNKRLAAERKARKWNARVYESFPIRNWDKWLTDQQTHLFVQSLEPGAKAKDLLAGTQLVSRPGFAGRTTDSSDELDAVWTPDGQGVVFVACTNRHTAAYARTSNDLFEVSAEGGEPKPLTKGDGEYSRPRFGGSGTLNKALYCLFEPRTQAVYNATDIVRFAWPFTGEKTLVTAETDKSVASFVVDPVFQPAILCLENKTSRVLFADAT